MKIAWRSSLGYFLSTPIKFQTTIVAMPSTFSVLKFEKVRLILLPALLAAFVGFLLSSNTSPSVHAFSVGPPPGYTGATGEEPEACAECHLLVGDRPLGQISISVPPTYIPGQTYPITVTNSSADNTRTRWGFELTVLDPSEERAGNLQSTDGLTQVLNNAGPGGARQYIEHTQAGTFMGQMNNASWTFNWTAPATDVGTVIFYAAGNHANNDGNSSGDFIYKTFVASSSAASTPNFSLTVNPSSNAVIPGGSAVYSVTVTPLAGFTGTVALSATGLPAGAGASFNPASLNFTDANSKSSTLTITTGAGTPLGTYPAVNITGVSGMLMNTIPVTLRVISPTSVDLSLTKSASPNPGQVGLNLSYRITVTNSGPALATSVAMSDTLPAGVSFVSAIPTQGMCNGTGTINCALGNLGVGATAVITIMVTPSATGSIINTATVSATETDFDPSNNSATITTFIQPFSASPTMLDDNLMVSTVVTGLVQPTSMAFIGANDFLVLEKASGKVQRVSNGVLQGPVLDLNVNSASERGLLGVALHPQFALNGWVYLFWTESTAVPAGDSLDLDKTPLLGNRVDRYVWNGSTLTFDRNLIRLRALQEDAGQPARGNHDGGVLRFGPDGKIYILFGDNGRRGFLQNITNGPVDDDQFGGPEPDDAHMTGVILRLNDDGSTPSDNPFFSVNTTLTGEAAANIKKIFAYGVRNGFGMAFDPLSGFLWTQENGDDAFDEMNRVTAGFNGGWIQTMGPLGRINQFKSIESTYGNGTLQQLRWPPSNIADTPSAALARMYMLTGAQYTDPEFSWKYAVAPSALGFVKGRGLGPEFESDMFVGASRTTLLNGYIFRFKLTGNRQHFAFTDPLLNDLVADNTDKFDLAESESLAVGRDFGVTTDIQTGPNGNVFVVSLLNGAIYEIKSKPSQIFVATLTGAQEVPPNASTATGSATLLLSHDEETATLSLNFSGLSSGQTDAHIHGPAAPGISAPPIFPLALGQISDYQISLTPQQVLDLKNGLHYINVHSSMFPTGEIRGQFQTSPLASVFVLGADSSGIGEGEGSVTVNVRRLGNTSTPATVGYATSDNSGSNGCSVANGNASSRCDYSTLTGSVTFAAGETSKDIAIPIIDDSYAEGSESFTFSLVSLSGGGLGPPTTATITINDNEITNGVNPIDQANFFVRQHYLDFLNREPDEPGRLFWTNQITSCGSDATCIELKRINVSAAFFLSIEFQQTGYLVYRIYKAGYGNLPGAPVPVRFNEFLPDTQQIGKGVIVGQTGWELVLASNKIAFAVDFVSRPRFLAAHPTTLTPAQFVDELFANAVVTPSGTERTAAINEFGGAPTSADTAARARVIRLVAEHSTLTQQEFNKAFVLMQYFGYLRRNPNDAPDADFGGYNFWLSKLNQFNGNFVNAEMVKAFLVAGEYKQRFGQ
ncbi:MAG: PQQ-dependent sugar dehydrogenase [Pyrinomonadaceae bacterium]|nr:PQQ-dependent sugar dehydrogenase [Pyrinomonadaceae bacterium]